MGAGALADDGWSELRPLVAEAEPYTDTTLGSGTEFGMLQLGLFDEAVPPERTRATGPALQAVLHPPRDSGRFQSLKLSNQDAVSVISLLFSKSGGDAFPAYEARALLTGQATGDLREVALGAAWIAAACLRTVDQMEPGLGTELLEGFGLWLAAYDDPAA